jgi:hypothetical protein
MEKSPKRLDRPTYWIWVVPLVLGRVFFAVLMATGVGRSFASAGDVLLIFLAIALAWRFRDIGWPVWIGPTILLVTMLGGPFVVMGLAVAYHADSQMMQWLSLYSLFSVSVNLVLLIVAGSVPGKPAPVDVAHVFE